MTRILVSAPGAEDARMPGWAHLTEALRSLGCVVLAHDPHVADVAGRRRASGHAQRLWLIEEFRPDLVVFAASGHAGDDDLRSLAARSGTRIVDISAFGLSLPSDSADLLCNSGLLQPGSTPGEGVMLFADCTDEQLVVAAELRSMGTAFRIVGSGWDSTPYAGLARGRPPYPVLAQWLRGAAAIGVSDGDDDGVLRAAEVLALERSVVTVGSELIERLLGGCPGLHLCASPIDVASTLRRAGSAPTPSSRTWITERFDAAAQLGRALQLASTPSVRVLRSGPKVTVLTAMYRVEKYIGEALESLRRQTEPSFEVVVVNDGSPDNSRSVAQQFTSDSRFRIVDRVNIGQTDRFDLIWRQVFQEAAGDYITFLGGDDIAAPNRLERQLRSFADQPALDIVHTAVRLMDDTGEEREPAGRLPFSYDRTSLLRCLIDANCVAHPTVMIRRQAMSTISPFQNGFAADLQMWLEAAGHLTFAFLPLQLTAYRVHEGGASTGAGFDFAMEEGRRLRTEERRKRSIVDFYPALAGCRDDAAFAAAHLDLGALFLFTDPQPDDAIAEFERALACDADPHMVALNMAVAHQVGGAPLEADAWLRRTRLSESDARYRRVSSAIQQMQPLDVTELPRLAVGGWAISELPFRLSPVEAHEAIAWDGRRVECRRVLVRVNWDDLSSLQAVVQQYVSSFAEVDPVELSVLTDPLSEHDATARLLPVLAHIPGIEGGPDIVLEDADDVRLLSLDRFAVIVDLTDGRSVPVHLHDCRRRFGGLSAEIQRDRGLT